MVKDRDQKVKDFRKEFVKYFYVDITVVVLMLSLIVGISMALFIVNLVTMVTFDMVNTALLVSILFIITVFYRSTF